MWMRESKEHKTFPKDSRHARTLGNLIALVLLGACLFGLCYAAVMEANFEVASIKPAPAASEQELRMRDVLWERNPIGLLPGQGRTVYLRSITLPQMIAIAYRVRTSQVISPRGLDTRRFDVDAKLPQGASWDLATEMLKNMLGDRFALKAHHETRDFSGLLLVLRPGGPHLKPADPSKRPPGDLASLQATKHEPLPKGASRFSSGNCTMGLLIEYLSMNLQTPIADRTGLQGEYDLVLEVAPPADEQDLDRQPRIMEAVRRLGLDLRKGRVPVNMVVVDSVAKAPTPN